MVEVSRVQPEDYEALATFLAQFEGETSPEKLWRDRLAHWWDRNPAVGLSVERGWLLKDQANVVGFLGNVPRSFKIGDDYSTILNATTWRVSHQYRHQSLSLFSLMLRAGTDTLSFDATPTDDVAKILEAFKFLVWQK